MKRTQLILVGTIIALLVLLSGANLYITLRKQSEIQRSIYEQVVAQVAERTDTALSELQQQIETVQAKKGDKGDPGRSIVGPQGQAGADGQSIIGPQGSPGKDGADGKNGDRGEPGKTLELQWSPTGTLQQRYQGDDFWENVPTEQLPQ